MVPDPAIREVVRSGAVLAPGRPAGHSQASLLDSIVLTAPERPAPVEFRLGPAERADRMGFLPRDCQAAIDTAPGWIRLAAAYGSTYLSDGNSLGLLSL